MGYRRTRSCGQTLRSRTLMPAASRWCCPMAACCASAPGQMRRRWRGWPRPSRHDQLACRRARAAGDAAGRLPPRSTRSRGTGGRGTRGEPVLRRGAGIPVQALRQGQDRALGCDGPGAGLEAVGGRHVLLAADHRGHRAAVYPAVHGAVLGARLFAAAKRETDSPADRSGIDCLPMREIGNPTQDLPDDPAVLRALLLAAWAERDSITSERDTLSAERDSITSERDSLSAERDALMERIERLQHLLRKLQRMQFGPRSERLPEDQLRFAFEEADASLAAAEAEAEKSTTEQRKKKAAPPGHARPAAGAPAARRAGAAAREHHLPLLPGHHGRDRLRHGREVRCDPGAVPRPGRQAAEGRLPG